MTVEWVCPSCGAPGAPGARTCAADGAHLVELGRDPLLGRVVADRLRLDARLGRGGMGVVYRAHQLSVGRDVAVKIIDGRLASDADAARRFLREARLASRIRHPSSVTVIDFGQEPDGLLWLAMELLEGEPLDRLLAREGALPLPRALGIARQLAGVLAEAHALGVVHRDLKPANVIVSQSATGTDHVTLLDFGIARSLTELDASTLTKSDVICGTVAYLSPEVACGDPADARADLYSLGVVLYELLSGRRPFEHPRAEALMRLHVTEPPPPLPAVPAVVESVVQRCLAKLPEERFQTAAALSEALIAAGEAATTRPLASVETAPEVRPAAQFVVPHPTETAPAPPRLWPVAVGVLGFAAIVAYGAWPKYTEQTGEARAASAPVVPAAVPASPVATRAPRAVVEPRAAPSAARRGAEAEGHAPERGSETAATPLRPPPTRGPRREPRPSFIVPK